ncbi:hypothetical protein DsansV1_C09g0093121 [Dioscorea sansibarensis]
MNLQPDHQQECSSGHHNLIIVSMESHLIFKQKNSLEPDNYSANMCCTGKSSIIDHQAHHAVSRAHVA